MRYEYTDKSKNTVRRVIEPGDKDFKKFDYKTIGKIPQAWWRNTLKGLKPVARCLLVDSCVYGPKELNFSELAREYKTTRPTVKKYLKILQEAGFYEPGKEYKRDLVDSWAYIPKIWWRDRLKGLTCTERCLLISLKIWRKMKPKQTKLAKELTITRKTVRKYWRELQEKGLIPLSKIIQPKEAKGWEKVSKIIQRGC